MFGIAFGLAMASLVARAQRAGKLWRIGYPAPSEIPRHYWETLTTSLRALGHVEGRTARIEVLTAQNALTTPVTISSRTSGNLQLAASRRYSAKSS